MMYTCIHVCFVGKVSVRNVLQAYCSVQAYTHTLYMYMVYTNTALNNATCLSFCKCYTLHHCVAMVVSSYFTGVYDSFTVGVFLTREFCTESNFPSIIHHTGSVCVCSLMENQLNCHIRYV